MSHHHRSSRSAVSRPQQAEMSRRPPAGLAQVLQHSACLLQEQASELSHVCSGCLHALMLFLTCLVQRLSAKAAPRAVDAADAATWRAVAPHLCAAFQAVLRSEFLREPVNAELLHASLEAASVVAESVLTHPHSDGTGPLLLAVHDVPVQQQLFELLVTVRKLVPRVFYAGNPAGLSAMVASLFIAAGCMQGAAASSSSGSADGGSAVGSGGSSSAAALSARQRTGRTSSRCASGSSARRRQAQQARWRRQGLQRQCSEAWRCELGGFV